MSALKYQKWADGKGGEQVGQFGLHELLPVANDLAYRSISPHQRNEALRYVHYFCLYTSGSTTTLLLFLYITCERSVCRSMFNYSIAQNDRAQPDYSIRCEG